jgi:hypothetical protein
MLAIAAIAAFLVLGATVASANPPSDAGPMAKVFGDEFNASALDTSVWTPGWRSDATISGPMTGSCVSRDNVSEGGGALTLSMTPSASSCSSWEGSASRSNTGGLVESDPTDGVSGHNPGFMYLYGYVEWSVYLPAEPGCTVTTTPAATARGCIDADPALWTMAPGHDIEIDTLERGYGTMQNGTSDMGFGCPNTPYNNGSAFVQPIPTSCKATSNGSNLAGNWHTYGALWTPSGVRFYYDGAYIGSGVSGVGATQNPHALIMDIIDRTTPGITNRTVSMRVD